LLIRFKDYLWGRAKSRQGRMSSDHPLVEQFWDTYLYLNEQPVKSGFSSGDEFDDSGELLNHSNQRSEVAVNLNHYQEICRKFGQEFPDLKMLKKVLPGSTRFKFLRTDKVKSSRAGKTLHCWVFSKPI